MNYLTVCVLFVLLINLSVFANTNDVINQVKQHRDQILQQYKNKFGLFKGSSLQKSYQYQNLIKNIKTEQKIKSVSGAIPKISEVGKPVLTSYEELIPELAQGRELRSISFGNSSERKSTRQATGQSKIIFVSFSMPDLALKQLIIEGNQYHIPVVIRGLYKNSFSETAHKIFELVKDKNQGGIVINPLWFREFNIQTVPAFVIKHGSDFDVVYGNISLEQLFKIINNE